MGPAAKGPGSEPQSLADIQQQSVENWLRYRESQGYAPSKGSSQRQSNSQVQSNSQGLKQDHAEASPSARTGHVRDDDLAL